ncbi:MAG: phenylalanine--tRNA ligase subunit beta [Chloroflexi bacterium]|nr:phenylalanine--tRNA ligase subunit beta [Chloroflexota bacterium]MBI3338620.1 phenylalanine--tRNA ligase subunit beta [Chloroflexota bacterium]
MKIPLSWLKDFIDLDGLSVEDIARKLTLAGLEVDEIKYVGLPMPVYQDGEKHEFKTSGIAWDKEKIVVAEIREVNPHPNADRLTLLDLFDGQQAQTVLTGAPNIFHLKGQGKLPKPIKVAYAKEGAALYDGHAEGLQLMTLKRAKIRGVDSYSMVCSEKELGIAEDHEGIILLDDDAPVGMPLADYMGDAVLDISILPNMARNANVIGVARELAALTGRELKKPAIKFKTSGDSIDKLVSIEITDPELNPRFVLGLIRDVEIKPSPYQIQRRLKLAGMRPINNIVDATNYAMLELGEPLHAFDYDVLKERAGNKNVRIITRTAKDGEKLITLDGVDRKLTSMNMLVCDESGPLSIAGVMGGAESEVYDASKEVLDAKGIELKAGATPQGKISIRGRSTTTILLEGAAWNFINIRRTAKQHNLPSEASFRFSRGVHPALAEQGVKRGLQLMAEWSGGNIAPGLVDEYPLKPKDSVVEVRPKDVKRLLGIELSAQEIVDLLERLEFKCKVRESEIGNRKSSKKTDSRLPTPDSQITVTAPPHRLDIGQGTIGLADVLEEVARSYGYDRIPETRMADALPPQIGNPVNEWEEHLRDLLVALGLQEVVTYRMTSVERESRVIAHNEYVRIANPIAPEKSILRRSLAASVLDALEKNIHLSESLSFFEIGPVFEPLKNDLPNEPRRLAVAMTGLRDAAAWDMKDSPALDFYDMKGRIELLLSGLGFTDISFASTDSVNYLHPGKAAQVQVNGQAVGAFGELHPLVREKYELGDAPVLVAEFDLEILRGIAPMYAIAPVPEFPPILEDIAVIVDESVAASRLEVLIRQTGGKNVTNVRLFDVYRGDQVGAGKKSLAYSLTYQAADKTMTDAEAAAIRNKIVKRLEQEVGAKLRS